MSSLMSPIKMGSFSLKRARAYSQGEICPDEQCPMASGDGLKAYHVRTVEARRLHTPSRWYLLDDQAQYPLHAVISSGDLGITHHVLYQPVAATSLVGDFVLHKKHDIKDAELYHPDGLYNT